ncbi:MAG: preprotein translocase subunit SecA [Chloroflexi bacterium]|nr:MAG: preprotein translocase subunit SecA [Chloroflexota bacterium]
MSILSRVFGDYNEKELKKLWPIVKEVNAFEDDIKPLSDEELRAKTDEFRERLDGDETLDDILPEAFAVVREMSQRRLGMRPFDVQILGGVVLHQGKISEMKTGEGKTLVATMPIYLNALAGKGAHLITVNDYLAKRDAQWMGAVYDALGLTIGILQHDSGYVYERTANLDNESLRHLIPVGRREVYAADITYGTNNEFGFDFLRDNMATDFERSVQRQEIPQSYAIVDEVDSILIDEARTPLIISGPAEETEEIYRTFGRIVPRMSPEQDLIVDLKHKSVGLTEEGVEKVEKALSIKNLYDPANFRLTRFLDAALKAEFLYQREHQYVVKDGEVVIVDEFTGRLMTGRRWSDGLHQAVEAKEGVKIQRESVTYATITLQNYFRMYNKLAGMTGTAWTERDEFHQIYGLDVLVIPTHRPMVRADMQDIIFKGISGKFKAVVEEIEDAHGDGRPMLVGTVAIETSELLSDALKRTSKCDLEDCAEYHQVCPLKEPAVLNAKQHEREAHIIAMAGTTGAVTIATNMAGRGTDIVLGGNPERMAEQIARKQGIDLLTTTEDVSGPIRKQAREKWQDEHDRVIAAGGLHIIGTERHESRRIDNQLRGRAGRQGDPGSSRFFVSFGDDLMKRFSPEWVPNLLGKMGMDEDTPLESNMVSKAIEQAQTKVEGHNFDIRKHVVQYDDVMNRHRDLIYTERRKILEGVDLNSNIVEMIEREIERVFESFTADSDHEMWDVESLIAELKAIMPLPAKLTPRYIREKAAEEALDEVLEGAREAYATKEEELGEERMRTLERLLFLRVIDRLWVYHLTALDELRQGIGLRGYGQRDPLVEFKLEAHDMYNQLTDHIRQNTVRQIYHVTLTTPVVRPQPPKQVRESGPADDGAPGAATAQVAAAAGGGGTATATAAPANRKIGRNEPCPCGSGKKYKKCHGGTGVV